MTTRIGQLAAVAVLTLAIGACQDNNGLSASRAFQPIPAQVLAKMEQIGTNKYAPVLLRAFKKESELEVWKKRSDGTYAHLKTYPMCRWSGQLGPKIREGDRQVPEGFYSITPAHMNPNSAYYLSFNIGYPNAFDQAHDRTGSLIMVHGACSSRGCFSMTDEQIAEIYAVVREAFSGGQRAIQLQSFPFRMTPENLAKHRLNRHMPFWRQLKEGSDHFEVSRREPTVAVCDRRYQFNATPANGNTRLNPRAACPPLQRDEALALAVRQKAQKDQIAVAALVNKGVRPIKVVYSDGDQHPSFSHVSLVSRPEALANGPTRVVLDDNGRPLREQPGASQVASAQPVPASPRQPETVSTGETRATRTASTRAEPGAARQEGSIVHRWFGRITGTGTATQPAESTPGVSVPTPPRQPSRADRARPDQRAEALPRLITGAHSPLPSELTAYAPLR